MTVGGRNISEILERAKPMAEEFGAGEMEPTPEPHCGRADRRRLRTSDLGSVLALLRNASGKLPRHALMRAAAGPSRL
jgi:hypothetical protein